ncbi:LLM class flavin-dependent oxidoreductase [Streptomyces sp. NPDC058848]|uniref:LLM class flavin-dependent oxidoreductase n=1 Tax=unclassified Streptomyces TaxID=2593676 RepID=UPI0036CD38F2
MSRPYRFGVNLTVPAPAEQWSAKCRRAEGLGYDVIQVPDHLGMMAPFPALVAAARATARPRLGTFVLNAGFWNPALLAREVATTDALTGGRLELGLGTGYVRAEHDTAGELDERVARYLDFAADREEPAELNLLMQMVVVTEDREAAVQPFLEYLPDLTTDQVLELPVFLAGTVEEITAQVRARRERYGFTYLTVLEPYMEAFAPVMRALRGD